LAARFWGDASKALGKRMQTPDWTTTAPTWLTVVGVARDIKYTRLNEEPKPYVYLPFAQAHGRIMFVHVRGPGSPAALVDRVVRELMAMDANLPIVEARPLADQTSNGASVYEAAARVLAFVGLAALTLAALGIYGLVTYIVRQSTHEIGIRLALGAPRGQIVRRFLMRGLRLGGSGAAIGVAVSLSTSRLMGSLLYDVAPTDLLSFTAAAAAVLCMALAASLVPAWRAARLSPLTALRQ
jgi:putative ABC transport system permease protein